MEQGLEIEIGKFPWVANGRALASGHSEGFVKVIRGAQYSEILGAHIVGPHATELIGEFVVGRHLEATVEEMDRAMHPHPTLSEAIAEGALSALGRAILSHLLTGDVSVMATTHHSELKLFAHQEAAVQNASVDFDPETLAPTYRLRLGLPGRNNARSPPSTPPCQ